MSCKTIEVEVKIEATGYKTIKLDEEDIEKIAIDYKGDYKTYIDDIDISIDDVGFDIDSIDYKVMI